MKQPTAFAVLSVVALSAAAISVRATYPVGEDQAQYDRYRGAVAGTQAPYGGKFLVRGAMPVMLGSSPTPQGTVVIIRFPA